MADRNEYAQVDVEEVNLPNEQPATVKGIVGNLIAFTATAAVASVALGKASKYVASTLVKRFTGLQGKTVGEVATNFIKDKYPQIASSAIAQQAQAGEQAYAKWSARWAKHNETYKSMKVMESGARWAVPNVVKNTQYANMRALAQAKDFFTRTGFRERATGFGIQTAKKAFQGTGGAYIADQAFGVFNPQDDRSNPSWYNIPGHALNFAKFAAQWAPASVLLGGGLGFIARSAKEAGIGGLRFAAKDVIGRGNIERGLSLAAKGAEQFFGAMAGVESAIATAAVRSQGVIPRDMGSLQFYKHILNPKRHIEFAKELVAGAKKGFRTHYEAQRMVPRDSFDNETMGLLVRAASVKDNKQKEQFLRDVLTHSNKPYQSGFEYITGLERKVNFEKELSQSADRGLALFKKQATERGVKFDPGSIEEKALVESFRQGWADVGSLLGKMPVQLQPGLFKGLKGSTVDLRSITPASLLNKAADIFDRFKFRIPGGSAIGLDGPLHPFRFFQIPTLLRSHRYQEMTEGSFFLGTNRTAKQVPYKYSGMLMSGDEGDLIKKGIYSIDSPKGGDVSGIYAGGQFFHYENGSIRRLHSPRVHYKLMQSNSLMTEVNAWMAGHAPLQNESVLGELNGSRSFFKRVVEKLDIGNSQEQGVFTKIRNMLHSYVWAPGNPHPNHIAKNLMDYERGGNVESATGFIGGLARVFNESAKGFSKIRTKRITESLLEGTSVKFNELDNFEYVRDTLNTMIGTGSGVNPWVKELGKNWNMPRLLDQMKRADSYNQLARVMGNAVQGGRSVYDTALDYITLDATSRNAASHEIISRLNRLSEVMLKKGNLDEVGAASMRVISYGLAAQSEKTIVREYMANMGGSIQGDSLKYLTNFYKTQSVSKDIDMVTKKLYRNPLRHLAIADMHPEMAAYLPGVEKTTPLHQSPWTAIPTGASGRMSLKEMRDLALAKDASNNPMPRSFNPMYPDAQGNVMLKGHLIWGAALHRFGRTMDPLHGGLNLGKYQGAGIYQNIGGPATQMFVEGILLKRAVPLAGALTAYSMLDKIVDVMPGLQGTPLGEGITAFGADQVVKARMGSAWLGDATGITDTAKYLEGLFPGVIDSPLLRAARGIALPIWLANKIGHTSGAAGKRLHWGALAGLALGGVQGFGMYDITKSTQELKEIYSGREEVPIRRGRFWDLSSSPWSGTRISRFQPLWYARLKAQARSNPDDLGCITADTYVVVNDGLRKAQDINVGDTLIDRNGNEQKVIRKITKEDSNVYRFTFHGTNLDLKITKDHEILIIRGAEIKWIPAKQIKVGDYMYHPRIKIDHSIRKIDMKNYLGDMVMVDASDNNKLVIPGILNNIDRYLWIDENLIRIFAYFLSKGKLIKKLSAEQEPVGVEFYFHNDEDTSRIEKLRKALVERFDVQLYEGKSKKLNCKMFYAYCPPLAYLCESLLVNKKHKKSLDMDFFKSIGKKFLAEFLRIFIHRNRKNTEDGLYIKTESSIMANQFRQLLFGLGIDNTLNHYYLKEENKNLWLLKIHAKNLHNNKQSKEIIVKQDYIGIPIIDIRREKNTQILYDFTVENEPNFLLPAGIIHNSPIEQIMYKPWPLFDFNPIGWLLGQPHHYAKQHMYSKPFGETGTAFREFPIIGPTLAATVGRIVAPSEKMHTDQLYSQLDKYGFSTDGGFTQRLGSIPGTSEMARAFPTSSHGIRQTLGSQLSNMQETLGLWGFAQGLLTEKLLGWQEPYQGDNVMETAEGLTSVSRSFYDSESGGWMGFNESLRRFIPKSKKYINKVNPLSNNKPHWLPVQYRVGTPETRIPSGEILLPGKAYSQLHNVNMSYPVTADMLGLGLEETVRRMLSLGRPEPIGREELEKFNSRAKAAAEVYEPYNDVSGTHDGIIRKGRRAILQKIKNYNSQDLNDMVGPTETDISEMNFYLRMAGVSEGVIQYRMDGLPVLAYPVKYNEQRFQKDMYVISLARRKAADLYAKGVGFEGEGYSHLDRAHVLSSLNPYSNEFKSELAMAKKEVAIGRGDPEHLKRIVYQANAIKMGQELYPHRFLGKVLTPDSTFNNLSLNENMKAASEYSLPERCVPKGTLIKTKLGYKEVENISTNDYVLTHTNQYNKVIEVFTRKMHKNEKMIKIQAVGLPEIRVTENHPVYTIKLEKCAYWGCENSACFPRNSKACKNMCRSKKYEKYKPEWVLAKNLTKNHVVISPLINFNNDTNIIDLKNIFINIENVDYTNTHIIFTNQLTKISKINRFIPSCNELYELIGWYLAEGSSNHKKWPDAGFNLTVNKNEVNVIKRLNSIITRLFGVSGKYKIKNNTCVYKCYSSLLSYFLSYICGKYAHNKQLNNDILNINHKKLWSLINAYFDGDGSYHFGNSLNKLRKTIKTVSKKITLQIRDILFYLNQRPKINLSQKGGLIKIINRLCKSHNSYTISWNVKQKITRDTFRDKNFIYSRILKITEENSNEEEVYNLEVENDHSYTADGIIVHNCAGALYEGFNSLNTPFDKFHSYKTPLEAYKANTLYGRSFKSWNNPIEHWADAYSRGFMSKNDPMTGFLAGFLGGYAFGPLNGPASAMLGSAIGALHGSAHGMYRNVTGSTYIPGTVQEIRNVNRYFDKLSYTKNMMLYDMTGNEEYLEEARSTMSGLVPSDLSRNSWSHMFRATSAGEKPFVMSFVKETDADERSKILSVVPDDLANVLRTKWAKMDGLRNDAEIAKNYTADGLPDANWAGFSPEVDLSDVKLQTVERMGFQSHDFGLGYDNQRRRIANSPGLPGPIDLNDPTGMRTAKQATVNQAEVRRMIERTLSNFGIKAYINITPSFSGNILTLIE